MEPVVSIIMPNYNGGKYISQAIESVLGQDHENWELLVIDDGSSDNSIEITKTYSGRDKRIRHLRNSGKGVSSARNTGIRHARGKLIAFLDSDDFYYPRALSQRVKFLAKTLDSKAVFCITEVVNERERTLGWTMKGEREIIFENMYSNPFHLNSVMIRKSILRNTLFEEGVTNGEDWLFISRLARQGVVFKRVGTCKVAYRQHGESVVQKDYRKHIESLLDIVNTIYGIDNQCPSPIPEYYYGISDPPKDIIIHKIKFGLILRLLLSNRMDDARNLASELRPEIWNQITFNEKIRMIKFSLMRYYRCTKYQSVYFFYKNYGLFVTSFSLYFKRPGFRNLNLGFFSLLWYFTRFLANRVTRYITHD